MSTSTRRLLRHLFAWLCLVCAAPFAHALSLEVAVDPDRVRQNEATMVSITVGNESAVAVNAVTVRLQMPNGVNTINPYYASGSASCPNDCDPGEFVTWTLGTIAAGRGVTLTMPLIVGGSVANGTAINMAATLLVNNVQTLAAARSVTVDSDTALTLDVHADRNGVVPGGTLTYSVRYGNRGGVSITGTQLALPLPAGATLVSASGGGVLSGNTVLWDLNTLQGGESGRRQVVVAVGSGVASGTLLKVDAAQVAGTSSATGATVAARLAYVSRVQSNPVLGLTIAGGSDPGRPGDGVLTAFTVTNPTTSPVFGAVLVARMPPAGFNTINPYYHTGGANCPNDCDPYEFVTWNLGTLAPGSATTVVMANTVAGSFASGRLVGIDATLLADGVPMTVGRRTLAVDGDSALLLAVEVDKDGVAPGDTLTYALTYGNRGPASVTGTTLRLPLPAGTTFVSATGGGAVTAGAVQWNLNTLQSGQSSRQQVVVRVDPALASGSPLGIDAAVLAGTSATTGAEAARTSLTSRVLASPGLALAIASNADPARPGEGVRTALTVSNRSADTPAFGVVLKARMPTAGFNTINPYYHSGGATCPNDCDPYEFVTWNIGTLAPGGSTTVWMANTVAGGFDSGRLVTIESELAGDGLPLVVGRKTLSVDGDNALTLALHADRDSAAPGERVTYTLDYANRSTGTVNGTVLTLPVPAGATLVGASGGTLAAGRVTWNLAGLLAGTGGRRTVTVVTPAAAAAGLQLRVDAATLAATSPVTGAEQARATTTTRIVAGNPLRLALVGLAPNPVLPGQTLTATLRVTNTGSAPLNTINLRARVPMEGVNTFNPSVLGSGGQCPNDCDPYEFAVWNFASLAPGASTTVTMPMTVAGGFANGRQIVLQAVVTDDNLDQSIASGTVMAGTQFTPAPGFVLFGDFDNNGVVSFSDLALLQANFGSSNALYDLNGDGVVNFADLSIFKTLFGSAAAGKAAARQ